MKSFKMSKGRNASKKVGKHCFTGSYATIVSLLFTEMREILFCYVDCSIVEQRNDGKEN